VVVTSDPKDITDLAAALPGTKIMKKQAVT
jgi:hypothetical protein